MTEEELIYFVTALDRCWTERRFDELVYFLHEDFVIVAPDANVRVAGIEPAIKSYKDFMSSVEIESYAPGRHKTMEANGTAVIEYEWTMIWRTKGQDEARTENGRETLVLANRDNDWRAIWRMQLPAKSDS